MKESAITAAQERERRASVDFEFKPTAEQNPGLRVERGTSPSDNPPRRESSSPLPCTESELVAVLDQHLDQLVKADEFSGRCCCKKWEGVFSSVWPAARNTMS